MRITVFAVTAIIEFAAAVFGLLVLLLSLNGYSEAQATPSLIFYIVFCVVSSLLLSFLGARAAGAFVQKGWLGKVWATVVSILLTSTIAIVVVVVAGFLAIILAEFLRRGVGSV